MNEDLRMVVELCVRDHVSQHPRDYWNIEQTPLNYIFLVTTLQKFLGDVSLSALLEARRQIVEKLEHMHIAQQAATRLTTVK